MKYLLGSTFADTISSIDHWLSFALLTIIGFNMIREACSETEKLDADFSGEAMFLLAIADSIDALAVDVTFAFMEGIYTPGNSADWRDNIPVLGSGYHNRQSLWSKTQMKHIQKSWRFTI